jgi:hypothetical protein
MGAVAVAGLVAVGFQQPAAPALSISSGLASRLKPVAGMSPCTNPQTVVQPDVFPTQTGTVASTDGKSWTVPATVHDGAFAVDVFNDCTGAGDNPDWEKQLQTVVIDRDGVDITGYIFADNYYELYVNGVFVARDRIAMTPFNSTVVHFRARYPMTYAIKAIDWETKYGLGMEYQAVNIGDGGFIAYFSRQWHSRRLAGRDVLRRAPGRSRMCSPLGRARFELLLAGGTSGLRPEGPGKLPGAALRRAGAVAIARVRCDVVAPSRDLPPGGSDRSSSIRELPEAVRRR